MCKIYAINIARGSLCKVGIIIAFGSMLVNVSFGKEDSVFAQSDIYPIHTLKHSIVTGSPLETDVVNIPGNISVIESKEIQKSPNTKISDILKKTAGVRIDNDVSFNPRPKIKIRGINYGTLLMLDGMILSDLEGENRIINQIFLEDIARVEIARGSYSSLYGTGAIGGVI
ncbi:TonB-dependent receptor plug domain-containing protein, partial [Helicobacter japonicus]